MSRINGCIFWIAIQIAIYIIFAPCKRGIIELCCDCCMEWCIDFSLLYGVLHCFFIVGFASEHAAPDRSCSDRYSGCSLVGLQRSSQERGWPPVRQGSGHGKVLCCRGDPISMSVMFIHRRTLVPKHIFRRHGSLRW